MTFHHCFSSSVVLKQHPSGMMEGVREGGRERGREGDREDENGRWVELGGG